MAKVNRVSDSMNARPMIMKVISAGAGSGVARQGFGGRTNRASLTQAAKAGGQAHAQARRRSAPGPSRLSRSAQRPAWRSKAPPAP